MYLTQRRRVRSNLYKQPNIMKFHAQIQQGQQSR
jgi:hypothetical protein